ncbi:MAG: hypothetical protein ACFFCF_01195 [Promethearchaeota archaeon]
MIANALWIIIYAIPYVIVMPLWFYIDTRIRRKLLGDGAKYAVLLVVHGISIILLTFNWMLATPEPLPFWPLFVWGFWVVFILFISSVICERFLKPKFRSLYEQSEPGHF